MILYIYYGALGAFALCCLIQLFFILFRHTRLRNYQVPELAESSDLPALSLIICARNEYHNLEQNLPAFLTQDYPAFEVVVVNDCSDDESDMLLLGLSAQYQNLKVVTLEEHIRFKHGKKFAVAMGIKAASSEFLVFTDADCVPASNQWLKHMQQAYYNETEIVLGYSPYTKFRGLLNAFIRFETFNTALNYLSFALAGKTYMGVGRNMSYRKALFFKKKGFASHMHIPSGDDDLFVNEHASANNTEICIHPDAQIWSEPKRTWRSYWKQKRRHMGAGRAYKAADKRSLSMLVGSATLFYILMAVLLSLQFMWPVVLGIYGLRLLIQLIVYYPSMKKLSYPELIWYFPFLDLFYYIFIGYVGLISSFRKPAKWA